MSLPDEKARAVNQTHEWLFRLLDRRYRPTITEIRAIACRLLKHYPWTRDIELMERAIIQDHNRAMAKWAKRSQKPSTRSPRQSRSRGLSGQ